MGPLTPQPCQWLCAPCPLALMAWQSLLAVLLITPTMGQASAMVTSSATFFSAITNPNISIISVPPDIFELLPEDWARFNQTNPYILSRDLLMRSSSASALGQMDFQFLMKKVLLGPNTTLTMERLELRNIKKLGGFGLDFFMGDKNSTIVLKDSVRVKYVCPPPDKALQVAQAFNAPMGLPANSVAITDDVCLPRHTGVQQQAQQRCYQDALRFQQFTLQVSSLDPEMGVSLPGYSLQMHNVTRLCENFISVECITKYGEDTCTAQLLERLANPHPQEGAPGWNPRTIAGVIVGATLGLLAVLAVTGWLAWKHHCWANGGEDNTPDRADSLHERADDHTSSASMALGLHQQLLPSSPTSMSRSSQDSAMQSVRLGVLLGSGSFGRVYKGRWHGMDVAVKIMDPCTPDTLPRVLKEAEVMMQLHHPNIVRAYQCSVWNPAQHRKMLQAASKRRSSESGGLTNPQWQPQQQGAAAARPSKGSSSSSASQPASSSSAAPSLPLPTAPAAGAADPDSVVISIIPEIVQHRRPTAGPQAAAAALTEAARVGGSFAGTTSSSSSTAAGALSTSSAGLQPCMAPYPGGSDAATAQQVFGSLMKHQQQEPQQQLLQGPSTASRSRELPHVATSLSSAAYTLSSSSSYGAATGYFQIASAGAITSSGNPEAADPAAGPPSSLLAASSSMTSSMAAAAAAAAAAAGDGCSQQQLSSSCQSGGGIASGEMPAQAGSVRGWWRRRPSSGPDRSAQQAAPPSSSSSPATGEVQPEDAVADSPFAPEDEEADKAKVEVWLVLELCSAGSLKDAVSLGRIKTHSCQEMAKLLSRLLDAANGMAYLHSRDVVHGDLKAANVLLQQSIHGTYGQIAKVSDFGVSAVLLDGATHRSTSSLGTITHMAPEVLKNGRLSKAADAYAFGIMMWEVFTNRSAFAGCHSGVVVEHVVLRQERPPVPSNMPPQYSLLMQCCWDEDPAKRPTFDQIITCLELLLDNLTSSDSEGHISEGVEEERTSSSSTSTSIIQALESTCGAAGRRDGPGDTPALQQQQQRPAVLPLASRGTAAGAAGTSIGASSSSASKPQHGIEAEPVPPGKGVAEAVEDWLSGPNTPQSFGITLEQLQGMRRWYAAQPSQPKSVQQTSLPAAGNLHLAQCPTHEAHGGSSGPVQQGQQRDKGQGRWLMQLALNRKTKSGSGSVGTHGTAASCDQPHTPHWEPNQGGAYV